MSTSDGKVVITVDSNAKQAATDFNTLDQSLKNVEKDGQQVAAGSNKMFGALGSLKGAVVAAGVAFAVISALLSIFITTLPSDVGILYST